MLQKLIFIIKKYAEYKHDATTQEIKMSAAGDCQVHSASGNLMKSATAVSVLNVSDHRKDAYVAKADINGTMTTIKIAK